MAFVTSRYTMDSKDSTARKHMAERADLLGAIRLPNNAFKANAGTDVVSDIIFLQSVTAPSTMSRIGCSWARPKMALPSTSIS